LAGSDLLILFLCGSQGPEPGVPGGLESIGHEAVVGIDLEEAALGNIGLVPGPLDLLTSEPNRPPVLD
jgi:hypothetical protein